MSYIASRAQPLRKTSCWSFVRCLNNWATVSPESITEQNPATVYNFGKRKVILVRCKFVSVNGEWKGVASYFDLQDPLNGERFIRCPDTSHGEAKIFVENLKNVSETGLHNPFKHPER